MKIHNEIQCLKAIEYPLLKLSEEDEKLFHSSDMLHKMTMIRDRVSEKRKQDPKFGANWDSLKAPYPDASIAAFMKQHGLDSHQIEPLTDDYFNFRGNMFGEPMKRMFLCILCISELTAINQELMTLNYLNIRQTDGGVLDSRSNKFWTPSSFKIQIHSVFHEFVCQLIVGFVGLRFHSECDGSFGR